MIIDFHTHLGRGDPDHSPLQGGLSPDMLLRVMDEAGVERSVFFPVSYRDFRAAIREMREYADRYPERLIPFGRFGDTPDAAEIARWALDEMGMRGFKVHHGLERIEPDSPRLRAALDVASERGVPVIFDAFDANLDKVKPALDWGLTNPLVLGHMGGLWKVKRMDESIRLASERPNVYLETSSVLLYEKIEEAVLTLGSERILFGTDGPPIHPAPEIRKIQILHVAEADKANILGLNAARLLRL